jgi:hypothetical protein
LILLGLQLCSAAAAGQLTNYRAIFLPCTDGAGTPKVAIRQYELDAVSQVLLVDPHTFSTSVAQPASLHWPEPGAPQTKQTPYYRALQHYTGPPYRLQNGGATRADHVTDGIFVTVDLCPSSRGFELGLFEALARLPQAKAGPVPVAIAVTKRWMESHEKAMAWLLAEVAGGRLSVTWVNHSAIHPYQPQVPLERNFLLTPGSDLEREVLTTEQALLARGVVPSVFFRFPGLVSDKGLMEKLRALALIPIGSDAWLAKGEKPAGGSFILVHGNGNEPAGVKLLLNLLQDRWGNGVRLLPLVAAFQSTP